MIEARLINPIRPGPGFLFVTQELCDLYQRIDTPTVGADVRACSNCDRPSTREGEAELGSRPAIYSCPTCGQREAVSWRTIPPRVVEAIEVVEEPHVILGEH